MVCEEWRRVESWGRWLTRCRKVTKLLRRRFSAERRLSSSRQRSVIGVGETCRRAERREGNEKVRT